MPRQSQKQVGLVLLLLMFLLACSLLARFRCQLKYMTGHIFGAPVVAFNEFNGFADLPERFGNGQHVLIVELPNDVHGAILKKKLTESSVWYCRESLPRMNVHFGRYKSWSDWIELVERLEADADDFETLLARHSWPRGVMIWFDNGRVVQAKEFCSLSSAVELYAASFDAFCKSRREQHMVPCVGSAKCYLRKQ